MNLSQLTDFYRAVGNKIKDARQKNNLTQEEFAKQLQLSRASIVNIEKGRQHPTLHCLWNIAKLLDTDISYLLPPVHIEQVLNARWQKIVSGKPMKEKKRVRKFIEEVQFEKQSTNEKL